MTERLKGKVALITGVGSGIGRATALRFAREGAHVIGAELDAARGEALEHAAASDGLPLKVVYPCNVMNRGDVTQLLEDAHRDWGGLDVLFCNAAMAYFQPFEDMDFQGTWQRTLSEELDVIFHPCQAAWPHLVTRGGGSIITMASIAAKIALEPRLGAAHAAAKGAVLALTRQLALEGSIHRIRVNSISPGLVRSAQTQALLDNRPMLEPMLRKVMLGRVGEPEDIAAAALYLASDEASWVTGADLAVDGGMTAW
jgi:NAD(P)-dependent dehydrogenase (short-subunit alcohol dehydrogenase family)